MCTSRGNPKGTYCAFWSCAAGSDLVWQIIATRGQMQAQTPFAAHSRVSSRVLVKPYCRANRAREARIYASAAAVNPLLPLWQQPLVHNAALRAIAATGASFVAANALSALAGKIAGKVMRVLITYLYMNHERSTCATGHCMLTLCPLQRGSIQCSNLDLSNPLIMGALKLPSQHLSSYWRPQ